MPVTLGISRSASDANPQACQIDPLMGQKTANQRSQAPRPHLPDPDPDRNPKTTNPALQVQRERLGFKRTSEANLTRVNQDEPRQGQIQFDGQGKTFEL